VVACPGKHTNRPPLGYTHAAAALCTLQWPLHSSPTPCARARLAPQDELDTAQQKLAASVSALSGAQAARQRTASALADARDQAMRALRARQEMETAALQARQEAILAAEKVRVQVPLHV
jgi:hypothetical protein